MPAESQRYERRVKETWKEHDKRSDGQRDYDRIIYCSAFMRLAGVSQVAHTQDSAVVHNRMIHSLKVATLGKGLAVRLSALQPEVAAATELDPDVVAAAALAHDLGHPPFGHVAEKELTRLSQDRLGSQGASGFEGNAQSFRTVTKLAVRKRDMQGLNLTRATLNGVLKYPWMSEAGGKHAKKWGAYHTEQADFDFARDGSANKQRSVEAEIMDFADDVAYSTHDLEDYYRAGMLPLDRLFNDRRERERFLDSCIKKWRDDEKNLDRVVYEQSFDAILKAAAFIGHEFAEPYNGTKGHRGAIRTFASTLIDRFFTGIQLMVPDQASPRFVRIEETTKREIRLLKQLIWHYVIPNRSLAIQEEGQRKIISTLFEAFVHVTPEPHGKQQVGARRDLLAPRYCEQLDQFSRSGIGSDELAQETVRLVVDVIAEMSEFQAVQAYTRLTGHAPNSFLDFAHR